MGDYRYRLAYFTVKKMSLSKLSAQSAKQKRISVNSEHDQDEIGDILFNFKLPKGLTLRSVALVDGVPEFRFEASPKVPTLQEADIAVAFRLASEKERPEFFYVTFPLFHPLHRSQWWFKQHSPSWLRWTKVGKLLADADWNMKCLHVGARTNEDKTVFKSWPASSNLKGLATHLDFPEDPDGCPTIKMHCDYAKVQKGENEIFFPEEPSMKIVAGRKPGYSEYITKHLPSVAYHDEPKFLKIQELIKLILAVEWLYNEKNVRVSKEWVEKHTSEHTNDSAAVHKKESKEPPKEMIPSVPSGFQPPSDDVTLSTTDSKTSEWLQRGHGTQLRYGYMDFGGREVNIFKEDGTKYCTQKCLKCSTKVTSPIFNLNMPQFISLPEILGQDETEEKTPALKDIPTTTVFKFMQELLVELFQNDFMKVSLITAANENRTDKRTPENATTNEISKEGYFNMSIPDYMDNIEFQVPFILAKKTCSDETGTNWKITCTTHFGDPHNSYIIEISIVRISEDNVDFILANESPNAPVRPAIPGVCEAIIPGVSSWKELITELSEPRPCVWQDPYSGVGERIATGGICTRNFSVIQEPLKSESSFWGDLAVGVMGIFSALGLASYLGCNKGLGVTAERSEEVMDGVTITELDDFSGISESFSERWTNGTPPTIQTVFSITNPHLQKRWEKCKQKLSQHGCSHSEKYYHGTVLACDITSTKEVCENLKCKICGITCSGMNPKFIKRKKKGSGFSLARSTFKCNEYTQQNSFGQKAMLLCDVLPGRKYNVDADSSNITGPPKGFDSMIKNVGRTDEIIIYNRHAIMPKYILVY